MYTDLAGVGAAERLVWSLVVVNPDEVIEALLLLQEVEGGRLGGLLLQCQVHALVATVLLGMSGLDALDLDAEAQPPDREPGEAEQRIAGGEGHAVVGADGAAAGRSP